MPKPRILILTEDTALRATLARWLLAAGYAVELAEAPRRALEVIASESLNLALIDARGATDAALTREIAGRIKHVVSIAQPAKDGEVTLPQVDGCLLWPFSEQDLLARIESELEEAPTVAAPDGSQRLRFENYTLDADARSLLDADGQDVSLTRAEFSLLLAFVRQPGRVLSRDELTHVVAGRGAEPDDRSVDVLISRLRRKIEPDPKAPRMIVTMPGEGYKFTPRPQVVAADPAAPALAPPSAPAPADPVQNPKTPRKHWSHDVIVYVVPAVLLCLVAVLGWDRLRSQRAADIAPATTAAPQSASTERRAQAFKKMAEALHDDRFSWRTIERLAVEAGIDETEAREILAEHASEVVLGKSRGQADRPADQPMTAWAQPLRGRGCKRAVNRL